VDLDGTLVRGDCLFAALFWLLQRRPLALPGLFALLLRRGRAVFKRQVALAADGFDASKLPIVSEVSKWCAQQADQGRELWLVSGSDVLWVEQAKKNFPFFEKVVASDGQRNVSGEGKRRVLVDLCGESGFDYVGNASVDLIVWRSAREAIVANASDSLIKKASKVCRVKMTIGSRPRAVLSFLRSLRVGQWIKNLLVIAPVLTSHRWGELDLVLAAISAAAVFCLVASGVYLVNDAWDCESDRADTLKRLRPVAAGGLGQWTAFFGGLVMMASGILAGFSLGGNFGVLLSGYCLLALLYSFFIKGIPVLDLVVLVGFYLMRIYAGGAITGICISPWLVSFAAAIFLFLGCLKRVMNRSDIWQKVPGNLVNWLGFSSATVSVVVLAIYPLGQQAQELYSLRMLLWTLPVFVGVWCGWIWHACLNAAKRLEAAEPVAVVLRDPWSWVTLGVCAGVMLWAI
jgi:phosphoserine phosphatase